MLWPITTMDPYILPKNASPSALEGRGMALWVNGQNRGLVPGMGVTNPLAR